MIAGSIKQQSHYVRLLMYSIVIYLGVWEHLLWLDDAPVDVLHEGLGVHRLLAWLLDSLLRPLGRSFGRLEEHFESKSPFRHFPNVLTIF